MIARNHVAIFVCSVFTFNNNIGFGVLCATVDKSLKEAAADPHQGAK